MDASPFQTLAYHRLYHSAENIQAGCQDVKDYVWCRPQGKKAPKRLNVSKPNQDSMSHAFLTDICNKVDAVNLSSENPEENWTVFHKQFILQLLLL